MKYTQAELEAGFKLVQPKTHWKDPINTVCKERNINLITQAVIHFTATVPTFTHICGDEFRVTADGYWMGPCGAC